MKQTVLFIVSIMALALAGASGSGAVTNKDHPSVIAALACIAQIAPIIKNREKQGSDVSCDLPVSLSEHDLDEIFKAALRSANMKDKYRDTAEKYSSAFAKTLTNFRAATCTVKLRIKRSQIIETLASDKVVLQLDDQPADCDVTTKKHKIQKLKFAFSPRIEMVKGCVADFALNMGKIDADCRVCYFNRLFLSTKLVSVWANHMSPNVKRALNIQLGERCQ